MKKANRFRVGTVLNYMPTNPVFAKTVTKLAPGRWLAVSKSLNTMQYVDDTWVNVWAVAGNLTVVHDNGKVKA